LLKLGLFRAEVGFSDQVGVRTGHSVHDRLGLLGADSRGGEPLDGSVGVQYHGHGLILPHWANRVALARVDFKDVYECHQRLCPSRRQAKKKLIRRDRFLLGAFSAQDLPHILVSLTNYSRNAGARH